ncbi:hypothetical protein M6B38_280035 [Iris pallida]|uniref:Uncharacterized protein n=1 Tax=Iris pallida TaxID=29817 RepID=A0AAX6HZG7_IRIPA|nr:hypothetical protein M6B38_280035 [Iris pallida]
MLRTRKNGEKIIIFYKQIRGIYDFLNKIPQLPSLTLRFEGLKKWTKEGEINPHLNLYNPPS